MLINSFIINNDNLYMYSNMDKRNTNILLKCNYAASYKYFIDHHTYYKKNFIEKFLNDLTESIDQNDILKNNTYYSLNKSLYNFNPDLSQDEKDILYKDNLLNLVPNLANVFAIHLFFLLKIHILFFVYRMLYYL